MSGGRASALVRLHPVEERREHLGEGRLGRRLVHLLTDTRTRTDGQTDTGPPGLRRSGEERRGKRRHSDRRKHRGRRERLSPAPQRRSAARGREETQASDTAYDSRMHVNQQIKSDESAPRPSPQERCCSMSGRCGGAPPRAPGGHGADSPRGVRYRGARPCRVQPRGPPGVQCGSRKGAIAAQPPLAPPRLRQRMGAGLAPKHEKHTAPDTAPTQAHPRQETQRIERKSRLEAGR